MFYVYTIVSNKTDATNQRAAGFVIQLLEYGYTVHAVTAAGDTVHYILSGKKKLSDDLLTFAGHVHTEPIPEDSETADV